MNIQSTIKKINRNSLTNNTQKVAYKLLQAEGSWVSMNKLDRIPSAAARVRDLRKNEFGAFKVECQSASALGRNTTKRVFYYRIVPVNITKTQVSTVFRLNKK